MVKVKAPTPTKAVTIIDKRAARLARLLFCKTTTFADVDRGPEAPPWALNLEITVFHFCHNDNNLLIIHSGHLRFANRL